MIWIALLRAVNVAGVNRLPMAEFRAVLEEIGLKGAKTHIQSGNVVFRSDLGAAELGRMIADAVLARFGFRPPVFMLGRAQLEAAMLANPFAAAPPEKVHFFFMEKEFPAVTGDFLRSLAQPGEAYAFRGKVLWLSLPDGIGRSKLAERIARLPVEMTARNGRSVAAIAALAKKLESVA
jgi:uncharacterized protein (DUF1697 family)